MSLSMSQNGKIGYIHIKLNGGYCQTELQKSHLNSVKKMSTLGFL